MSSAYQQAQLDMGIFSPDTVSVGDRFAGALIPGFLLVGLYIIYIVGVAIFKPESVPPIPAEERNEINHNQLAISALKVLVPPLFLIVAVLGSILGGLATPTEAASVGAVGAILLAISQRQFNYKILRDVSRSTTQVTAMVFLILIGASVFSLVFRGFGGDELVADFLHNLPGGVVTAVFLVMLLMFLLGFILDFIEITFVVVPVVGPILLAMDLNPVWLGIMIAMNLQTSFLTPPFGFSLFYLRGVAPPEIRTTEIYKGVLPFIIIQVIALGLLAAFPQLATWLPNVIYGG
jgi:tripartite ATP-independent transporter DctM subunit